MAHARDGALVHAAAARLARARIIGDIALEQRALSAIAELDVVNPERIAFSVVPLPFATER